MMRPRRPPLLLLRALIAFLLLPGIVAGLIPMWLVSGDAGRGRGSRYGVVIFCVGLGVVLWCVRDFYVSGLGTLAPWDPPRRLVRVGLYRLTRNPMYVGVLTVIIGWSMSAGSRVLAWYAVVLAAVFHVRVILFEEPWLARQFGSDWTEYARHVPRWIPRPRPWHPPVGRE